MAPPSTVFIGRSDELTRLAGLLDGVEQSAPAAALIAGEAGVGKTRLASELASIASRRGFRVLVGGCMETGDVGLPYVPLVDAFRALGGEPEEADIVGAAAASVPNLARLLPLGGEGRAPARSGDELDQVELFGAVHSLLVQLAERAPLLLVMEDIHWADRSTRDLLSFLVRTLRSGRVGLVATYRSDELHRRHPLRPLLTELVRLPVVVRVDLNPFDRAELSQYLESLTDEPIDAATVERILDRSEGNAFFVEELVAAGATAEGALLPDALADVLRVRIESLSTPTQELLKLAAVAGRRVGHEPLLAASGLGEEELEEQLREAIAGQVLLADPATSTYRFRHALLQEAVYGDLLPGERVRLHGTYAKLLKESGPAAELAHHCLASHDLPGALAALVDAASEALSVAAPAETMRHLADALEIWPQVSHAASVTGIDHTTLLLRAATASGHAGEFDRAVAFAEEAVAECDEQADPIGTALAYERLGEHRYQGEYAFDLILGAFKKAVDLVPPEPPSHPRALVTAGLARALVGLRMFEEARAWCDEALRVARAVGSGEDESHALITLATLEQRHENIERARTLLDEARLRARSVGARFQEQRAQYSLGGLALDNGELQRARVELEEAVALAHRYGLTWGQYGVNAGILRAFTYYALGLWDEAERLATSPNELKSGAGGLSAAALFVEVARGDPRADERLARLDQFTDNDWVDYLRSGCGIDHALWKGNPDDAAAQTASLMARLDEADEAWELSVIWPATLGLAAHADVAEAARRTSDDEAVARAHDSGKSLLERSRGAEHASRSAGRQVGPEAMAWLARAAAEWTRLEGRPDPEAWRAAVEAFGYGYVYEEARCRWRLAEALLATGEHDEAEEVARLAHETATDLGAEPLRSAVEALARRGRLNLGEALAPPQGAAGLTSRELEVLALVAHGRSNQQIADELFISRKTASVHVSHILSKLGVQSRGEAAALAHRTGLV